MHVRGGRLALAAGCGLLWAAAVAGTGPGAAPAPGHSHAHPAEGPHKGTLIELGREDYHAELVHDDSTDTVTIHILDASATKAVAIPARLVTLNMRAGGRPQQFALAARPQPGEGEGTASAFVLAGKDVCRAIDERGATGRLNVEIGGKVYVGKVGGHTHPHGH